MTCHDCQKSLLQLLDPAVPPADVSAHLAECQACQQYQQRLVRIEANVTRIPVPASSGLEALKRTLREKVGVPTLAGSSSILNAADAPPNEDRLKPRLQRLVMRIPLDRRGWLGVGLAAAILIGVVGVFVATRPEPNHQTIAEKPPAPEPKKEPRAKDPPKEPTYLAQLLDCDVRLATGNAPAQRTQTVAELAGHLQDGIESKPDTKTLQTLAAMYRAILSEALIPSAKLVAEDDRGPVISRIVHDMVHFRERVVLLFPSAPVMKEIAKTTDEARSLLTGLLPGEAKKPAGYSPRKQRAVAVDWKRELHLVQAIVDTARKLAVENNPLQRARFSHELAATFARDIKQAAADKSSGRAAELGRSYHKLLTRAVAENVNLTRTQEPGNKEVDLFVMHVATSTQAIETDLGKVEGMQDVVQDIANGRREVEMSAGTDYQPRK